MTDQPAGQPVSTAAQSGRGFRGWTSRHQHLVGFAVGTIAALLGAAVFYWLVESKSRDLAVFVNPTRTTVVKSGQSSDLHVVYRGQGVSTDVSALQVEIWNAGKESIRTEHILSPVVLTTSPRVPILEARLRHVTRPVSDISLDTTHLADGAVGGSWKILEHNDGAAIQLILAGPPTESVVPAGIVEGQQGITVLADTTHGPWYTAQAFLVGWVFVFGVQFTVAKAKARFGEHSWMPFLLLLSYLTLGAAIFLGLIELNSGRLPPFSLD